MKIWFLYHSGFAVKTAGHFLVFDYWKDTPKGAGLEGGVIDPEALAEEDVAVFASHRHGDHYNAEILDWRTKISRIRYILSDDIPCVPYAEMVGGGQRLCLDDITVETLSSTDEGVAFLVKTEGLNIYHAGDLNWWHWSGETKEYNDSMAKNYKQQIDLLKDVNIDLAFVPVDPRLQEQYVWGLDYLMQTAVVRHAVPMHFFDETSVIDRLLKDPITKDYRGRILPMTRRGEFIDV